MSENKIVITSEGLLKDSRKLIEKRSYDSSKITVVGTPFILDGVASSLSETSYLTHSIDFSDTEKIRIKVSGMYATPASGTLSANEGEVLWCLTNDINTKLYLQIFESTIALYYRATKIIEIENVTYKTGETVNISVELTSNSYKVTLVKDSEYKIFEGSLSNIDITSWTTLYVGIDEVNSKYYWQGSINLTELEVYKGTSLYYTPSNSPVFNFTKVLVSDGTIELTDSSVPVLKHVYEFPISSIQRTGNTLLFTTSINTSSAMNISEIGLYSITDEGTLLYATIDELSIKKSADLEYTLIFNVDLQLNVVNTTVYPEITVETEDSIKKYDFLKVQRTYTYAIENLERASLLDNTSLAPNTIVGAGSQVKRQMGYDRAQNVLNMENDLEVNQRACRSCEVYNSIKNNIIDYSYRTYDSSHLNVIGSPTISEDGVLSDISLSNYVTNTSCNYAENFEITIPFEVSQITSGSQEILSFYNTFLNYTSLSLYVDNTGSCNLSVFKPKELNVTNSFFVRQASFYPSPLSNTSADLSHLLDVTPSTSTNLYAWSSNSDLDWSNCHATITGSPTNDNWSFSNLSSSNYLSTPNNETFMWSISGSTVLFDIIVGFTISSLSSQQCLVSGKEGDYYIDISLNTSGNLVYKFGDGTSWTTTVTGSNVLEVDRTYQVKVSRGASDFTCYYSEDGGITWVTDVNAFSGTLPANCGLKFGINVSNEPFLGSINMGGSSVKTWTQTTTTNNDVSETTISYLQLWQGVFSSDLLYVTSTSETTSDILYDSQGYVYQNVSINQVSSSSELFSQGILNPSANVKYYISITCDNGLYSTSYYTDTSDEVFVSLPVHPSSYIRAMSGISFGVVIGPGSSTASSALNGKIYLKDTDIIINNVNISPSTYESVSRHIKDFYAFMDNFRSFYYVNNLSGLENSRISYLEGDIKGNKDEIDFANQNNFSLCIKANLKDNYEKVILSKLKLNNYDEAESYFILEQTEDYQLKFTLFYEDDSIELIKQYTSTDVSEITIDDILVTITFDYNSSLLRMYVNNTLVAETNTPPTDLISSEYSLHNSTANAGGELEVAEYNYVKGIMSFEGVLQADDIFLLTNLTDTNY